MQNAQLKAEPAHTICVNNMSLIWYFVKGVLSVTSFTSQVCLTPSERVIKTTKVLVYKLRILCFLLFKVLLGAFTKLRKATSSFVVSLLVFVRIERLGTYWKDFDKI